MNPPPPTPQCASHVHACLQLLLTQGQGDEHVLQEEKACRFVTAEKVGIHEPLPLNIVPRLLNEAMSPAGIRGPCLLRNRASLLEGRTLRAGRDNN